MTSETSGAADKPPSPNARTRAKKRAVGLVPKEVWIHPSRHAELKQAVARLQSPAKGEDEGGAPGSKASQ